MWCYIVQQSSWDYDIIKVLELSSPDCYPLWGTKPLQTNINCLLRKELYTYANQIFDVYINVDRRWTRNNIPLSMRLYISANSLNNGQSLALLLSCKLCRLKMANTGLSIPDWPAIRIPYGCVAHAYKSVVTKWQYQSSLSTTIQKEMLDKGNFLHIISSLKDTLLTITGVTCFG